MDIYTKFFYCSRDLIFEVVLAAEGGRKRNSAIFSGVMFPCATQQSLVKSGAKCGCICDIKKLQSLLPGFILPVYTLFERFDK